LKGGRENKIRKTHYGRGEEPNEPAWKDKAELLKGENTTSPLEKQIIIFFTCGKEQIVSSW